MQNSTAVAARAVVMLACLALLPLFALFGSSTPELLAKLFDRGTSQETASPNENLSEAPEFHPGAVSPLLATGPGNLDSGVTTAHGTTSVQTAVPAGYNMPVAGTNQPIPTAPRISGPIDGRGPSVTFPAGNTRPSQPGSIADFSPESRLPGRTSGEAIRLPEQPRQPSSPGIGQTAPIGIAPRPSPPQGDTFVSIQERLRDLGAVYFRLESWGSGQEQFRFQCEMAVAGTPGLTRHFEAVNRDPLLAMNKVLAEAEAWHASR